MQKVTVSVEERHLDTLQERQEADDVNSRSEALRRILDEYEELSDEYEDLHTRYEELQNDLGQERNRNRLILEQREEHTELVKYVQEERTQEQRWREAGLATRLKWQLFGMDTDGDE